MTTSLLSSPITPSSPTPHQSIQLSLQPDFSLSLSTTSLLGSRAKLQDLPKIEQLVASRLRSAIAERVVWPRFFAVGLPSLGIGISRAPGEGEDEFVMIDRDDLPEEDRGEAEAGETLGEKLMREMIPSPSARHAHLGAGGGAAGKVSRMIEEEGVLKRRSFDPPLSSPGGDGGGSATSRSSTGQVQDSMVGARERRHVGSVGMGTATARPQVQKRTTGLGGGVGRNMPGGSDWGEGGM